MVIFETSKTDYGSTDVDALVVYGIAERRSKCIQQEILPNQIRLEIEALTLRWVIQFVVRDKFFGYFAYRALTPSSDFGQSD